MAACLGSERLLPLDLEQGDLSIPEIFSWGFCGSRKLVRSSQQSVSLIVLVVCGEKMVLLCIYYYTVTDREIYLSPLEIVISLFLSFIILFL